MQVCIAQAAQVTIDAGGHMHAIRLSPHSVEVAKSVRERTVLVVAGIGGAGLVILILAAISWCLWFINA
jgi:hypothetical protein